MLKPRTNQLLLEEVSYEEIENFNHLCFVLLFVVNSYICAQTDFTLSPAARIKAGPQPSMTIRIWPGLAPGFNQICIAQQNGEGVRKSMPAVGGAAAAGSRGMMMSMPRAGSVPLPILPALPTISDIDFYAQKDVPHGKVEQVNYKNNSGQDKRTLYITARSSLYSVRTKFAGQ